MNPGQLTRYPHRDISSFMKLESLLLCSQDSADGLYPESHESNTRSIVLYLKIHINIILLSLPPASKRSVSIRISRYRYLHVSHILHACCMPYRYHSLRFIYISICWVQIMELLISQFSVGLCYFFSLKFKYPCHNTSCSQSDSRTVHVVFVGGKSGSEAEGKPQILHTFPLFFRFSATNYRFANIRYSST